MIRITEKISYSCSIKFCRFFCNQTINESNTIVQTTTINGKSYEKDEYTNVTPKILSFIGKNLHNKEHHPLCLTKQNIINYIYSKFIGRTGNPIFSVYDSINPVVTVKENFDSLLVPYDHVSRKKTDCYYVNKEYMLRAHTTAHQFELIKMGLDNFIVFGDVYRRDEIDRTHYPVFHQADGVYSVDKAQIESVLNRDISLFEETCSEDTEEKQKEHTLEATQFIENHLKTTLLGLIKNLYKKDLNSRWVSAYFPFTHPSWELEIELNGEWTETLGCGIIRHDILKSAGAGNRVGWAFGLGLERLAMQRYQIPDIRYFWNEDSGFTSQFDHASPDDLIVYKEVSTNPPCLFDVCFWLPKDQSFSSNDFYDLVREIGGDIVEQVKLTSEFFHPKKQCTCHTYRIIYRHMERPLTKTEINKLHLRIASAAVRKLNVELRLN